MPSVSKKQKWWVASPMGREALGAAKQREWMNADKGSGKNLPVRVKKKKR